MPKAGGTGRKVLKGEELREAVSKDMQKVFKKAQRGHDVSSKFHNFNNTNISMIESRYAKRNRQHFDGNSMKSSSIYKDHSNIALTLSTEDRIRQQSSLIHKLIQKDKKYNRKSLTSSRDRCKCASCPNNLIPSTVENIVITCTNGCSLRFHSFELNNLKFDCYKDYITQHKENTNIYVKKDGKCPNCTHGTIISIEEHIGYRKKSEVNMDEINEVLESEIFEEEKKEEILSPHNHTEPPPEDEFILWRNDFVKSNTYFKIEKELEFAKKRDELIERRVKGIWSNISKKNS